jgi:hypothetical protein
LQITHNKSRTSQQIDNDPSDDNSMTPSMRGKKKQQQPPATGHTSPQSGEHSALTGRGSPGRVVARQDEMDDDDLETSPSRKRKRAHNNAQHDDAEMSPHEANGNDGELSDSSYSELGIRPTLFLVNLDQSQMTEQDGPKSLSNSSPWRFF